MRTKGKSFPSFVAWHYSDSLAEGQLFIDLCADWLASTAAGIVCEICTVISADQQLRIWAVSV